MVASERLGTGEEAAETEGDREFLSRLVVLDRRVPLFLLTSGLCALVYQVAWLRLLRLVFGASTAASAATLGIFMGGLGLGSLWLGPRVDRSTNPLRMYARLEIGIGLAAGLSPWAIYAVAWLYRSLGGTEGLGSLGGTTLRLFLSAIVLGIPTFLMGGTLPAAVRSVTTRRDLGRRSLGLLYGVNTFGAVLGAAATTFLLLEALGTNKTVWLAALVNLLVALWAQSVSRRVGDEETEVRATTKVHGGALAASPLVVIAAFAVGLVFFLQELVWYRMLGPILGGSTYTFGVILSVALAGVGAGGWLYSRRSEHHRPTLVAFALTCSLEAALLLIPFAVGDRLALFAQMARDLRILGFAGLVVSWFLVSVFVILPAALVAGYQFPLLVGILGQGRQAVGRQIGLAYAANTLGAILGSVAGGFWLIPWLGAPTLWRATSLALVLLALVCLVAGYRESAGLERSTSWMSLATPVGCALVCLWLVQAAGPGGYWRHDGIGAGRSDPLDPSQSFEAKRMALERGIAWEIDGRESSVALLHSRGYSFLVNGKSDGHAVLDGGTQVMSPLVGALLHPNPRRGLVIGLGTGSSAGWLAAVPSIESVDVYELEEAILRVAEDSKAVNHDVLNDPKVSITIGDGRELLLTTDQSYDLIFSEPSNPYRAGVSSLFTVEFYRAAAARLEPGGYFLQWLQAYEVDAQSMGTVVTTLRSVFPSVEVWQVGRGDLLLLGSDQPVDHEVARTRRRVLEEPYASALAMSWGLGGGEGFYAGFVASSDFADRVLEVDGLPRNTDDLPVIEYGFARSLGRAVAFDIGLLRQLVERHGWDRPVTEAGELDWELVAEMRTARWLVLPEGGIQGEPPDFGEEAAASRVRARVAYFAGDLAQAAVEWFSQESVPQTRADRMMVAHIMAETGHPDAMMAIGHLAQIQPTEAAAVEGLMWRELGEEEKALQAFMRAFELHREDPWPAPKLMAQSLIHATTLANRNQGFTVQFFDLIGEPFAVEMQRANRLYNRFRMVSENELGARCLEAFADYEPYPIWELKFLSLRQSCYLAHSSELAAVGARDLSRYLASQPRSLEVQLLGSSKTP